MVKNKREKKAYEPEEPTYVNGVVAYCNYCRKSLVHTHDEKYCPACVKRISVEKTKGFAELQLWRYGGFAPINHT
jgi:hypothetical protein